MPRSYSFESNNKIVGVSPKQLNDCAIPWEIEETDDDLCDLEHTTEVHLYPPGLSPLDLRRFHMVRVTPFSATFNPIYP